MDRKKAEKEQYYTEHKEEIEAEKERKRQESIINKEIKRKEYYQKNKEKINANRREWLKNNKEVREKHYKRCAEWQKKKLLEDEEYRKHVLEYQKEWRNKNRERVNERTREWRKRNPEKVKIYEKNRYLKRKNEEITEKEALIRHICYELFKLENCDIDNTKTVIWLRKLNVTKLKDLISDLTFKGGNR